MNIDALVLLFIFQDMSYHSWLITQMKKKAINFQLPTVQLQGVVQYLLDFLLLSICFSFSLELLKKVLLIIKACSSAIIERERLIYFPQTFLWQEFKNFCSGWKDSRPIPITFHAMTAYQIILKQHSLSLSILTLLAPRQHILAMGQYLKLDLKKVSLICVFPKYLCMVLLLLMHEFFCQFFCTIWKCDHQKPIYDLKIFSQVRLVY